MTEIEKILENPNLPEEARREMEDFINLRKSFGWDKNDWGDDDQCDPITDDIVEEAFKLFVNIFEWLDCHAKISIPTPSFSPISGGIDIVWDDKRDTVSLRLLINVSKNKEGIFFSYYGDVTNGSPNTKIVQIEKKETELNQYKRRDFFNLFEALEAPD